MQASRDINALRHVTTQLCLVGAYGRSYETKKDAVRDWEAGLDFKIQGGPYCSIRDLDYLVENSSQACIATSQGYVKVA